MKVLQTFLEQPVPGNDGVQRTNRYNGRTDGRTDKVIYSGLVEQNKSSPKYLTFAAPQICPNLGGQLGEQLEVVGGSDGRRKLGAHYLNKHLVSEKKRSR